MLSIFIAIAPVFLMIGIGYISVKIGYFQDQSINGLSEFVFKISIPALLFSSMVELNIEQVFHPALILSYFATLSVHSVIVFVFMYKARKATPENAVIYSIGGTYSNLVFFGVPLVIYYFGKEEGAAIFSIVAFHSTFLMTLAAVCMTVFGNTRKNPAFKNRWINIPKDLVKNPIILALLTGLLWNLLDLPFPKMPAELMTKIGKTAGLTGLFVVGASLNRYKIQGKVGDIASLTFFKLLLLPTLVSVPVLFFTNLPNTQVAIAIVCAALPAGVNSFLIADHYKTGTEIVAGNIVLTTAVSIFTIPLLLLLLSYL